MVLSCSSRANVKASVGQTQQFVLRLSDNCFSELRERPTISWDHHWAVETQGGVDVARGCKLGERGEIIQLLP